VLTLIASYRRSAAISATAPGPNGPPRGEASAPLWSGWLQSYCYTKSAFPDAHVLFRFGQVANVLAGGNPGSDVLIVWTPGLACSVRVCESSVS
jgi:hypothetical protein